MQQQYIYFLRLVPRLRENGNWTEEDNAIVRPHFRHLQALLESGQLILAGRTQDDDPMGIVIIKASSREEAEGLMRSDPAVAEGIMTAQLRPYQVALMGGALLDHGRG